MSFLNKLREAPERLAGARGVEGRPAPPAAVPSNRAGAGIAPHAMRLSNGLKDFLWHLSGVSRGSLLDLGPVSQTTVSFFIERGFKVYAEDLLWSWNEFLRAEEERLRALPPGEAGEDMTPSARAERFLAGSLQYPAETFDAVLAWDLLDYLDSDLVTRVVARLTNLLKGGGVVLAIFHSRKPEGFYRYRVLDAQSLELISAPTFFPVQIGR